MKRLLVISTFNRIDVFDQADCLTNDKDWLKEIPRGLNGKWVRKTGIHVSPEIFKDI